MSESERYREALAKIAEVANAAVNYNYNGGGNVNNNTPDCVIRTLPKHLLVKAAEVATRINPVNAPVFGPVAEVAKALGVSSVQLAVVVIGKYWGPTPRTLTVSFIESTPSDLRRRIVSHMNAWTATGCIQFVETQGAGDVRISRGSGGYWSYLGTDITLIPNNEPTMNLEGFTMSTPESEYRRVVRHETGHTLGMPHEHMRRELVARIDPEKAYEYFRRHYSWDRQTVDEQVLTTLDDRTIIGTPPDETSIMCYQLDGSITHDGRSIPGGLDINPTDYAFVGRIYPKSQSHQAVEEKDLSRGYATA